MLIQFPEPDPEEFSADTENAMRIIEDFISEGAPKTISTATEKAQETEYCARVLHDIHLARIGTLKTVNGNADEFDLLPQLLEVAAWQDELTRCKDGEDPAMMKRALSVLEAKHKVTAEDFRLLESKFRPLDFSRFSTDHSLIKESTSNEGCYKLLDEVEKLLREVGRMLQDPSVDGILKQAL